MSRPPDPERMYFIRRMALSARLVNEGELTLDQAQDWIAAWEVEARRRLRDRLTDGWWDAAWAWIAQERGRL